MTQSSRVSAGGRGTLGRPRRLLLLLVAVAAATWTPRFALADSVQSWVESAANSVLNAVGAPPLPSDAFPVDGWLPSYESSVVATNGIELHVTVWQPEDGPDGKPVLLGIPPWLFNELLYSTRVGYMVQRGFVVVGYSNQGFGLSGGEWDAAGPQTVADISTVIDWIEKNIPTADVSRLGVFGVSYGAGLGILGAAHDKRIRAVLALAGWGDLHASYTRYRTPVDQPVRLLKLLGSIPGIGKSPAWADYAFDQFVARNETYLAGFSPQRSPVHYLDELAKNAPAIFFASGWRETIFQPNDYTNLFESYAGPKRYDMRYGDHAVSSGLGILGVMTEFWSRGIDWFDAWLNGNVTSGILDEPSVRMRPSLSAPVETAERFADLGSNEVIFALSDPSSDGGSVGILHPSPHVQVQAASQDWSGAFSHSFSTDGTTGASAGLTEVSNLLATTLNVVQTVFLDQLDLSHGAAWLSPIYPDGLQIRGSATLAVGVQSTSPLGTIVAYLYSYDPSIGAAEYIQSGPCSFPLDGPLEGNGKPFGPVRLTFDLFLAMYDLERGRQLLLVIQGSDVRLTSQNPAGSVITLSGDASEPATLTVPIK